MKFFLVFPYLDIHQVFINHVRDNRGDRLAADDETLFNGQYWIAETGLKLGLVDGIDNIDSYIAKGGVQKKTKKKVVILLQPPSVYLPTPIVVMQATFYFFFDTLK